MSLPCEVSKIGKNNVTANRVVNFGDTETVRSDTKRKQNMVIT